MCAGEPSTNNSIHPSYTIYVYVARISLNKIYPLNQAVGGDGADEETVEATTTADEPPAVQSSQRRMTLIANNAALDVESEHDEDYDDDQLLDDDDDDYERYSDEEELELQQHADELHAEEAAKHQQHSFEPIQSHPVVSDQFRKQPIQKADSVEKAVTFAAEPPVPIVIEKDEEDAEVPDECEYDGEEGGEEEDEDELEYDEEYDEEDLEEEYDEEAEEEEEEDHEDVSDIDDADLMLRLESKYGKLDATVEQSDEDDEVMDPPRATVTSNFVRTFYSVGIRIHLSCAQTTNP